jgi:hypothetical protein
MIKLIQMVSTVLLGVMVASCDSSGKSNIHCPKNDALGTREENAGCKYNTIEGVDLAEPLGSREKYFECGVSMSDGDTKTYSFSLDEENRKFYLTEGSQELEIKKLNSTQIWANNTVKMHRKFEYDDFIFYINRITGSIEVSYSVRPTKEYIEKCKSDLARDQHWDCESHPVLTEHAEKGICKLVERQL